ncbi:ribosomal protein L1p/L10e family-domain-containing protein [Chytriomyces cf. hyalinus JEL632]|nr:ribosomal protein L1p/L10e family-domain-containing protein [Chytriomyces cf. hyalinus JEL632]
MAGKDPVSSDTVQKKQIEKAVKALFAFDAKISAKPGANKAMDLLEDDADDLEQDPKDRKLFWLMVSTKKMPETIKIKPVKIPIVNSFTSESAEVCLFTKDPQKDFKALLQEKGVSVDKVIGVSKLKANYHSYEAKRKLCDSYDLFLSDDRIVSLLPPLIGKAFFAKKKHPVPVDLTAKDLAAEIESARAATYLHLNKGLCNAIKIGTTQQSVAQVVDNIYFSIDRIVDKVPSKWSNVQSILLKLSDSVSLPLYNSLPEVDAEVEMTESKDEVAKKSSPKKASKSPKAAEKKPGQKVMKAETPAVLKTVKGGKVVKKKSQ